jgi:hypothetical protein
MGTVSKQAKKDVMRVIPEDDEKRNPVGGNT